MEQKKFSPKDARLIRNNPEKSPDDLLVLGLSKAAYNRLRNESQTVEVVEQVLQPAKVEKAGTPYRLPNGQISNHVVRLHNKYTDVVIKMGYRAAKFLSSQNPKQFEIL
jgi:hypothetical protein